MIPTYFIGMCNDIKMVSPSYYKHRIKHIKLIEGEILILYKSGIKLGNDSKTNGLNYYTYKNMHER